ncbi:MAG: patatin-like phospholipase family protein [Alphaproteobacteria bacterium]|nr:patatin-like phospholipase family protein [Alphaproteobacteria bacterium]
MTLINLALGGGGARGLAHIPMLEAFDELGLKPHRIAGTSVGAVVGALYASGIPAADIRADVEKMLGTNRRSRLKDLFGRRELAHWFAFIDFEFRRGGLMRGRRIQSFLKRRMPARNFENLKIPLKIVAADFWSWDQVVFDRGDLTLAVKASMSVPGMFTPVRMGGHVLIDGGTVNPLPYDLWQDECDTTIAIEVAPAKTGNMDRTPRTLDAVFTTIQIMQRSIIREKMRTNPPDLLIRPKLVNVRLMEFHKARQIFEQAEPEKQRLKEELKKLIKAGKAAPRRGHAAE